VLYSGGVDSTHFIERENSARHLIHYSGLNSVATRVAVTNANLLNRYLTVVSLAEPMPRDGETNQIHALLDTQMAIDASIRAVSFGMKGIVMCFNADDLGIDSEAIENIVRRAEPDYRLLLPLRSVHAKEIRSAMESSKLRSISCMNDEHCDYCAKCLKGF
jgi:hypothetical protein